MEKELLAKRIRLYSGVVLAAMTLIFAALLFWQLAEIFSAWEAAGRPHGGAFSRADVGARLSRISPAFYVWIVLIVAAYVLSEIFPVKEKKKPYGGAEYAVYRMRKKLPDFGADMLSEDVAFLKKQDKILLILRIIAASVSAGLCVYAITYLSIDGNFTEPANATGEVITMAARFMPCVCVAMLLWIGVSYYRAYAAKQMLPHVKKLVKESRGKAPKEPSPLQKKWNFIKEDNRFLWGVRAAVIATGVVLFAVGIANGNMTGILQKAINICTECIGLG